LRISDLKSECFAHAAVDFPVVGDAPIAIDRNLDNRDPWRRERTLEGCAKVFPRTDSLESRSESRDNVAQIRSMRGPEVGFENFGIGSIRNG
jgi:hypothetical protein